jgi:hypothetical protein
MIANQIDNAQAQYQQVGETYNLKVSTNRPNRLLPLGLMLIKILRLLEIVILFALLIKLIPETFGVDPATLRIEKVLDIGQLLIRPLATFSLKPIIIQNYSINVEVLAAAGMYIVLFWVIRRVIKIVLRIA